MGVKKIYKYIFIKYLYIYIYIYKFIGVISTYVAMDIK